MLVMAPQLAFISTATQQISLAYGRSQQPMEVMHALFASG